MLINILEAVGVCATDQLIKNKIESDDGRNEDKSSVTGKKKSTEKVYSAEEKEVLDTRFLCEGLIKVRHHHNYGFSGNMSSDKPAFVKMMSVILTAVVSVFFVCTLATRGNKLLKTGLSLMLGAAFSNTYDRLKRGYVVDYFSIAAGPKAFRQLVWNIADFALIIGALLTVIG